jgi:uncharacterized membrane protein YjjB (DUF3815 family)
VKFLLIFLASLAIGVLSSIPPRSLLLSSIIAVAGSMVESSMLRIGAHPQEAAFAASFAVAILAELLARKFKVPSPVLSIPGIIPLVPGSVAYRATTYMVDGKELMGAQTAIGAALTAVGIASGLLLASALSRRVIKPLLDRFADSTILPGEQPGDGDFDDAAQQDYSSYGH